MKMLRLIALGAVLLVAAGCQTGRPDDVVLSTKSPVELRAMQSRAFETSDRRKTLRAVVATLQDLGYSVEKVEPDAGTVTATKLAILRLTASVYPRGSSRMIVRANALVKAQAQQNTRNQVDDPEFYLKYFFEPLSKAMFLSALEVQDGDETGEAPAAPSKSVDNKAGG